MVGPGHVHLGDDGTRALETLAGGADTEAELAQDVLRGARPIDGLDHHGGPPPVARAEARQAGPERPAMIFTWASSV